MEYFRLNFLIVLLGTGILILSNSCAFHHLDVQTQYLSHENLASYYTKTPDPYLDHPIIGQRLLIQWSLSCCEMNKQDLFLQLSIRFRNREEQEIKIAINRQRGFHIYQLLNQAYKEAGGILTYKVEIHDENGIISSWIHPLWVKLIQFDSLKEKSALDLLEK